MADGGTAVMPNHSEHRPRTNSGGSRGAIMRNSHPEPRGRRESPAGRSMNRRRSRSRSRDRDSARSSLSTMDRDEVLATLGYRAERSKKAAVPGMLDRSELCLRCGKKVYPMEKIDVGGLYHKGCFKCKECGVHLTLKTFQRDVDPTDPKRTKEVYCGQHVPRAAGGSVDAGAMEIRRAVMAQKHASAQMRRTGYEHESHYDPSTTPEYRQRPANDVKKRKKVKRRSTLRSSKDFEKFGVYDAQRALEEVHRQEEDELYRQMSADRKRHVDRLERHLRDERNRTVREIIAWFEGRGATDEEREAGLKKIESYYAAQREERVQLLLQRLTMEEQAAVARIIEKHSQEMLVLIQAKEKEAERAMKFEFRESQLLEGRDLREISGHEELEDEEEEEDEEEDEEDDTQEISESFSEASYRVDLCEQSSIVRRVVHPSVDRTNSSGNYYGSEGTLDRHKGSGNNSKSSDDSHSFQRHGSQRSSMPHRSRELSQAMKGQTSHHSHEGTLQDSRSHHGSLPFEYFPYELDDEGQVLVRVHAAKDAHLISDHLKSSHFCQSPEGNRTQPFFYDFGSKGVQNPKPFRRKASEMSGSGQARQAAKSNTKDGKGKKKGMKFQRLGEAPEDFTDEDEDSKEENITRVDKENANSTGRKGKGKKKRASAGKNSEHENADINTLVKRHADRAREALRQMSLGIDSNVGDTEGDDVFLDTKAAAPEVAPPSVKKRNLYKTPDVFKDLDENAVQETKREHRTFTELVRKLSKRCQNELQRVRAIFRWITAKDLNKMQFSDTLDPESPAGLLRGIKFGVESYHNLFKRLCSYAGMHCEIVEGYSKGAGYRPGGRFKGNAFRNQWTAVNVDGAWRFVNCNWGARHTKGPKDDHLTYKCDEFYFLTDPEDHIYQHYPDDPHWQLLNDPISIDEFVKMPVLKSPFFNRQLAFSMDYDSTVHTSDGCVEIRIMCPKSLNFAAQLKSKDGHIKPEILQDRVLVRLVNDEVIFLTNLPSTGNYYLEIYVDDPLSKGSMANCCAFRVCCYSISSNVHISYPPIECFGRTPYLKNTGIKEETHSDPFISHNGELLIAFFSPTHNRISHSLRFWNHRDRMMEDMDRFAFMTHRSDHLVTFVFRPPKRGGYVFTLLTSTDPDAPSAKLKPTFRYYIDCRTACENARPLPKATKRWQGCRLVEPLCGDLPCRTKVRFKVESASILELVVSVDDNWTHLQKSGNIWQGIILTGDERTRVFLYGRFGSTREKYIPLLEYQVRGTRRMEDEVKSLIRYM